MSISQHKFTDEEEFVRQILEVWAEYDDTAAARIAQSAAVLIETARNRKSGRAANSFQGLMEQYDLSSREGLALMCLAEALLRVPDANTANALIEDKIADADWDDLFGQSMDWLGRLSGMGLKATQSVLGSMASRLGMPVIRNACVGAMQVMARSFVLGRDIEEAVTNGARDARHGYTHSYDMLGEGARTFEDAQRYFEAYKNAIAHVGKTAKGEGRLDRPGVSVKLSALHPRYEATHAEECIPYLQNRLEALCRMAMEADIALTVDAEEADRLDLSLDIITSIFDNPVFKRWDGYGLAVQAYQKRALDVIGHMLDRARGAGQTIQIRLVKGAYWDSEVKHAQIEAYPDFPVFTRKAHTDVNFLSCARMLLQARDICTPLFGTHNAHSIAAILDMTGDEREGFAFQRLQGMGEGLYSQIVTEGIPCSIYAPVGTYKDLLAYLVRRLLENGANTSFVNRLYDLEVSIEELVSDPILSVRTQDRFRHKAVCLPYDVMQPSHDNSKGMDLSDSEIIAQIEKNLAGLRRSRSLLVGPVINGTMDKSGTVEPINSPADRSFRIGQVHMASLAQCDQAMDMLAQGQKTWAATHVAERAELLNALADKLAQERANLMAILCHEAGKTVKDALDECREAEDFCRYYAAQAQALMGAPNPLPGPTGEENFLMHRARGVFVCISPWNFPLAIFLGQVSAALVTGNAVAMKPAPQTPLIAARVVRLMLDVGFPGDVMALLPGHADVGQALITHPACSGVAFTGSTATSRLIARALADRDGPLIPLIAETGGQNAMIVDSTALPEQVCDDVIHSAFGSAGQRCSALRILCVQEDVADDMIDMIVNAMKTRHVGHPQYMATDIGPVIDHLAHARLMEHKAFLMQAGKILGQMRIDPIVEREGHYIAPTLAEISDIGVLKGEVFGPFLHVIRYKAGQMDRLIEEIHATGFGLTLGLHSRIHALHARLIDQMQVGNIYINRGMTGAIVGSQPFGGRGLSGTGPKAGGPYYLHAFTSEVSVSINSAAAGGNAQLLMMNDEGDVS